MKINRIKFPASIFGGRPSLWIAEWDTLESVDKEWEIDVDVKDLNERLVDTHIEIVTSDDVLPNGKFIYTREEVKKKDPIKYARRWAIAAVVLSSISFVFALIRVLIMEGVIK